MTDQRWPYVCTYGHQWHGAALHPDDRREGCPVCVRGSLPTDYLQAGATWAAESSDEVRTTVEFFTGDPLAADLAMTCHEVARYLLAMVAQLGAGDYDPADVLARDWAYLQATGLTDAVRTWAEAVGVSID